MVGLGFEMSTFGPRPPLVFRKSRGAVRAIAAHIDDISGCGEPDLLSGVRSSLEERFGKLKVQDKFFRARGHGSGPGGRLPNGVNPGGLREESEIPSYVPKTARRLEGTLTVGRDQGVPVCVGRALLGCHGFLTGYMRNVSKDCLAH